MKEEKENLLVMYLLSHVFIGFGAGVRLGLGTVPVALIVWGCVVQAVVTALLDARGIHMYIHKFVSMLVCSFAVIFVARATGWADSIIPVLNVVYLPVATGAMLVEQTYGIRTAQGRKGMVRAIICFACLSMGYSIALTVRRIAYV